MSLVQMSLLLLALPLALPILTQLVQVLHHRYRYLGE
jgi:hypothetical protein